MLLSFLQLALIVKYPAKPSCVGDEEFIPLLTEHSLAEIVQERSVDLAEAIIAARKPRSFAMSGSKRMMFTAFWVSVDLFRLVEASASRDFGLRITAIRSASLCTPKARRGVRLEISSASV